MSFGPRGGASAVWAAVFQVCGSGISGRLCWEARRNAPQPRPRPSAYSVQLRPGSGASGGAGGLFDAVERTTHRLQHPTRCFATCLCLDQRPTAAGALISNLPIHLCLDGPRKLALITACILREPRQTTTARCSCSLASGSRRRRCSLVCRASTQPASLGRTE